MDYQYHSYEPFENYRYLYTVGLSYKTTDTVFAWLSLLVGFIFAVAMPISEGKTATAIAICLIIAFGIVYARVNKLPFDKSSRVFAAAMVLFTLGFITGANKVIHAFLLIFLILAFFYWTYTSRGLSEGIFGKRCFFHVIQAIFFIPLLAFVNLFPSLVLKQKDAKSAKLIRTLLWTLAGLACAVIPTVIIVLLLSYDESFTNLLDSIFTLSYDDIFNFITDLILGTIAACLLFGSLYGTERSRDMNDGKPNDFREINTHLLPRALLCAAVTPVLAVYVLFFISQWSYYVSAFTGVLPGDLTYANYARSGFFQLCWVCGINALLLLLFNILIKKNGKDRDPLKSIYTSVISVFTLVLIATALSKMILYIDSYGLTQKRVYASWLMVLFAVAFIIVLIGQFVRRIPIASAIAVTAVIFFGLIALPDVDGMIASYNVNAYLSGDLETVDVQAIYELGASGVPALSELREELMEKPELTEAQTKALEETNSALITIKYHLKEEPDGFLNFNIPTQRARSILERIPDEELIKE